MRFRIQRGGLDESMATVVDIPPTRGMLSLAINRASGLQVAPIEIEVKPYGYDPRIQWDTHIVSVNGAAVGFTDGPLKET